MGKEAVEVNQQGTEQIGATNWKDEQIAGQNKPQVSPFPYDQSMGEPKDFQTGSTFQPGPDVGSGLEIRPPVKEFHGDKWQNVHGGGMQNLGQFSSDTQQLAPVMEEPPAGGFHGDKWGSQWSALPPTHSDVHSNNMGDRWGDKSAYQDSQVRNDIIKNEAREDKQAMHAELKSRAGTQDVLIKPSDISGHRFEGMTTDGRSIMPDETVNVHDGRSGVNFYDGRDATSINDGRTTEEMPLKERVVSGVRAGDPLSFHKDHTDKPFDKEPFHSGFPRDEHLKNDRGLIPHEHLKKDHPTFPTEHISGGQPDHIFQEKHQHDAEHLRKLHENPQLHGDTAVHGGQPLPGSLHNEPLESDVHDRNLKEQGTMGGIKEKIHHKKEQLKEKLGLKKDDETRDIQAHPRGHEIATIKIPGIEARDRAAQEMVNQQAKAKKELNAELKGHAVHSDHITPSEILTHAVPHHEDSGSKVSTHLTMPAACVITDPVTRDQAISKSEVNAEILDHAGDLRSSDLIRPSDVSGSSSLDHPQSSMGQSHSGIPLSEGFQSNQGINQSFGNKDFTHDSLGSSNLSGGHMNSLGSSNLSGGHMGSFNKDIPYDSSLGSSNLSGGHMGSFGNKDMNLGSNDLTGERMGPFANKDLHHEPLESIVQNKGLTQDLPSSNIGSHDSSFNSSNLSGGHMGSFGNRDLTHDSSLGSSNLSGGHMGSFGNKDMGLGLNDSSLAAGHVSSFGNKDLTHGSSLGSNNLSGGHMGSFGHRDMTHDSSLGSSNLSGGHMGSFGNKDLTHGSSLGSNNLSGGHVSSFGNKDLTHDSSLGSNNLSGGHMGGIGHKDAPPLDSSLGRGSGGHVSSFGNKDMTHDAFGNKDFSHDSLASDKFGTHKDVAGTGIGISQPILNNAPDNRSGGLDANNDQIMRDHVKAKRELNAEIKELPKHTDSIMPSEMGTTSAHTFPSDTSAHTFPSDTSAHTVPSGTTSTHVPADTTVTTEETHHLSTADKIKEKVSQAAQAVKDTFKKH